jgi:hypothetical protein
MGARMARTKAADEAMGAADHAGILRIEEECLELDVAAPGEASRLRSWIGRVNGPSYPQPYLVEGPPGVFRLYVGSAAERIRTRHGII